MKMAAAAAAFFACALAPMKPGIADPAATAAGKNLATNGNAKGVPACLGCHGANGEGQADAGFPRLAGIDDVYLDKQLIAFSNGTRENTVMSPIAKMMDSKTMADAAAYYASLAPPPFAAPYTAKPAAQIEIGKALALRGDWSENVPACASCHGRKGLGVGSSFPPIAGQSATYITNQLDAWRSGARHDDPMAVMKTVAIRLDHDQIAAVSAYYETLPTAPDAKPSARAVVR